MKFLAFTLVTFMSPHAVAQFLHCSPTQINLPQGGIADIQETSGLHVKFRYAGVTTLVNPAPNFVLVVPSSGTTPAGVQISTNPTVLSQLAPGGIYFVTVHFETVDVSPVETAGCQVRLDVPKEPRPSIQSVLNAASHQPFLAPGAQLSILGSNLTGPTLSTDYDATASYPTVVAGTSVTFNGIAAPLLDLRPDRIRAIVPFALAGQTSAQVVVQRFNQVSDTFTLPLQDTAPGVFTDKHSGTGAGPVLQQGADGQFTSNTPDNPAAGGTTLKIYAIGVGLWSPPPKSDVFLVGENFTTRPVSLMIGGQPTKIGYVGTAGTFNTWSVLQVIALVPDGLPAGPQPLVLTIGNNDNSQQQVTVWVQ